MTELWALFAVIGALAAILANIAVWSPRRLRVKAGAVALVAVFLPAGYLTLTEMLSRPKPVNLEWAKRELDDAAVLGSRLENGRAIYLWLEIEGVAEPRAYALPWDEQMAIQLRRAERTSEGEGTQVRMHKPFQTSLDDRERLFYAAPPPPLPLKRQPVENPFQFEHSGTQSDVAN